MPVRANLPEMTPESYESILKSTGFAMGFIKAAKVDRGDKPLKIDIIEMPTISEEFFRKRLAEGEFLPWHTRSWVLEEIWKKALQARAEASSPA